MLSACFDITFIISPAMPERAFSRSRADVVDAPVTFQQGSPSIDSSSPNTGAVRAGKLSKSAETGVTSSGSRAMPAEIPVAIDTATWSLASTAQAGGGVR
jgi:hypothetical protein